MARWDKWEYWPPYMFYIPLLPYYFYLAIRARHPVFFVAANPGIEAGGSGFESKYKTILLVPEELKPVTIFVPKTNDVEKVKELLSNSKIDFPFIIKPDVGFRGLLVSKISSEVQLKAYIEKNVLNLIIQEFIDGTEEYGVFYHRVPGEDRGKITSLTKKVYLQVVGDGRNDISTLMQKNEIAQRFIDMVKVNHSFDYMSRVPAKGESLILSHIGNHSKGATFVNVNDQITQKMEEQIDVINKQINGWYYGRLDLKVKDMNTFLKGESIKIIEINGVLGEPTHIYDSTKMTYFSALKEILRHWDFIYKVSMASRKKGAKFYNFFKMLKQIVKLIRYKLLLEDLSKVKQ